MDLTKTYSARTINNANATAMMITEDEKLMDKYGNLHTYLEKRMYNPTINPIYEIRRRNATIVLERRVPNRMYAEEYPLSMRFLPRRYTIPRDISKSISGRRIGKLDEAARNSGAFRDMIRKFVVIDAPRGYV